MGERTKTIVAGIAFDSYVMNASGVRDTTLEELKAIADSGSSAVVMKSSTMEPRQGNPEPRYAYFILGSSRGREVQGSLQCMGLPNEGYRKYVKFARIIKTGCGKPVFASVAGLSEKDYPILVGAFQDGEADAIEVNVSCPNLEGKALIGYDFDQVRRILDKIPKQPKPIGLKLPPYLEQRQIQEMADIVKKYGISFITCINSIPNALVIDGTQERPLIRPKKGLGALCGGCIKPVALGNVKMFYDILRGKVSIIGVGGISSGSDAFDFLLTGADAVQIGTCFEKQGPACFARINRELEEILERKGYKSIEQARGKLKFLGE
ncbi:MAG: dihydroorotate oxidase [Candidatus Pacearchaeota archaeon]|nr:dihydroorotate oxidase [Candidatus Pacearchaeota archaeon]